jgi:hypothetical protein
MIKASGTKILLTRELIFVQGYYDNFFHCYIINLKVKMHDIIHTLEILLCGENF